MRLDLVYFDGFAGSGRYERDADQAEGSGHTWGSPILAMRALEAAAARHRRGGLDVRTTGVIVENDALRFAELRDNLRIAGLAAPIVEAERFTRSALGAVSVIHGDFSEQVEPLVDGLTHDSFLLAFVDPYGTSVPMSILRQLVGRPHTDVVTLFPVYNVRENAGSARKPEASRSPSDRGNITRLNSVFDGDEWLAIAERDYNGEEWNDTGLKNLILQPGTEYQISM